MIDSLSNGSATEEALRKEFQQVVETLVGTVQNNATTTIQNLTQDLGAGTEILLSTARAAENSARSAEEATARATELVNALTELRKAINSLSSVVDAVQSQVHGARRELSTLQEQVKVNQRDTEKKLLESWSWTKTLVLSLWFAGLGLLVGGSFLIRWLLVYLR